MSLNGKTPYFTLQVALVALFLPVSSARAQTVAPGAAPLLAQQPAKQGDAPARGSDQSDSDVEQLKKKVEQLQSVVEQQQRALAEVLKRLGELDSISRASVPVTSSKPDGAVAVSPDLHAASLEVSAPAKTAPASQPAAQDKPKPVAGWDKNHAFLRSADGSFETFLTGYGQFDYRGYQAGNHPPDTFLVRRARLSLEGKLERYFDFKIEGDFADTTSTLLRDFYINVHRMDEFQLRFGQFKQPFSQEELRADIYQDFVERSLVNNLAPSRSPGFMASGVIDKGVFEYQVGAFNGKGLLTNNNTNSPEGAVRVRLAPWKNTNSFLGKGLFFGGAFADGRSLGGTSFRGLTESRSFTYFAPDTINGEYTRANGEMTWLLGPATVRAEYDQTNQHRDNLGVGGRNLPGVVAKGYMAQFTYLLTGEEKPDAGAVTPKRNLFGDGNGKSGFGAWELKFRYSNLQFTDGTTKSNRAETFYFGPNWYLNRFVKYLLDVGVERYKDPIRSPKPGDRNFFVVLSRIQIAF
ncbi:MAG TPA: porin [Blastocatellia bacterium]|nr:porin [Blastocatellia bacterium]